MKAELMVHNANQIAKYFATFPREEAVAGVADHIQKFWEPRMRKQLYEYLTLGGSGLHPLVLDAAKVLR
jgi:formate dehydrogenase subunit delta